MGRILLASGEENLRRTRQLILEQAGYEVVSTLGVKATLQECSPSFDLFVIGHSIPSAQRQILVHAFRRASTAPIVCLTPSGDYPIAGVDCCVEATPESMVAAADELVPRSH